MENSQNEYQLIVEIKNLHKIYNKGRSNEVHALNNVNVQVASGEFISVMGPSGCGKTTLLNMIGMLDKPSSGELIVGGEEVHKLKESKRYKSRRNKVGFIFQKFYLIPTQTALENVLSPLLPVGIKKEHKERAKLLLKEVGLENRMKHYPNKLSGGESQRVAIARALIMNPSIILADEPTGNLDSHSGASVLNLLKKFNHEFSTTFVVVTHDPRVAMNTQRIIFLKDGMVFNEPTVDMPI